KWFGPFIKLEACWQLAKHWMVTADAAYHQVDYRAQADWNLIAAFAQPLSFRHRAEGYGVEAGTRLCYRVGSRIVLDIGGGYFNWQTGTGTDQLYLSAGGRGRTPLNGGTRDGWRGRDGR